MNYCILVVEYTANAVNVSIKNPGDAGDPPYTFFAQWFPENLSEPAERA